MPQRKPVRLADYLDPGERVPVMAKLPRWMVRELDKIAREEELDRRRVLEMVLGLGFGLIENGRKPRREL